ncbi:MAG TPA: TIGR03013 family XrtA/PEP-CTERM system glycosyltransferase [Rhizomicrobium sp.]|jgi:sugar transferase (PEP-CTERM system associated)|nr:TIGR03013 family XrtA/PEP-CTERM system glycosyltransferase [Rhizomicrobium sp.]
MRRVLGQLSASPGIVLGILEASLVALGCGVAFYRLVSAPTVVPGSSAGIVATVIALAIVLLMYSGGLYDRDAVLNTRRVLWRIAIVTLPVWGIAVLVTGALAKYTVAPIYPYRWQWTLALTAVWLLLAVSSRLLFREVYRTGYFTRRILYLGPAHQGAELSALASLGENGFRIVAQVDLSSDESCPNSSELVTCARHAHASEIVVAMEKNQPLLWQALFQCRFSGLRVTEYLDFFERESRRLSVDNLREDWIALSQGFRFGRTGDLVRRLIDVALASIILIVTAPLLVLTAIAIKLEDGGPVLYCQERIGFLGQSFVVLKFRSMRSDAERDGIPAWAMERDSRVTAVGRFIRKVRIDELPQFLNVLRGSMAIIGPRPERPYFVQQFSQMIPFYDYRHTVKPGITGWAQVSFRYGASLDDTKRKLSYDLYYIKHRSFLLDIIILLRTVGVVVRGDGAR